MRQEFFKARAPCLLAHRHGPLCQKVLNATVDAAAIPHCAFCVCKELLSEKEKDAMFARCLLRCVRNQRLAIGGAEPKRRSLLDFCSSKRAVCWTKGSFGLGCFQIARSFHSTAGRNAHPIIAIFLRNSVKFLSPLLGRLAVICSF